MSQVRVSILITSRLLVAATQRTESPVASLLPMVSASDFLGRSQVYRGTFLPIFRTIEDEAEAALPTKPTVIDGAFVDQSVAIVVHRVTFFGRKRATKAACIADPFVHLAVASLSAASQISMGSRPHVPHEFPSLGFSSTVPSQSSSSHCRPLLSDQPSHGNPHRHPAAEDCPVHLKDALAALSNADRLRRPAVTR